MVTKIWLVTSVPTPTGSQRCGAYPAKCQIVSGGTPILPTWYSDSDNMELSDNPCCSDKMRRALRGLDKQRK